ncbi:SAM-dependent methyltransferase [Lysobacter helvus]|uniref:SAM-dependent methyltransferase n=2 Tax=Lysobacteraceae TaxID=32033 RepID=A0ABM7Q214_9GAMM|nr:MULTISPECIES: methyltransferase domain-containing protein [Lysobacter]BCT91280.1 SAM-dependent methyltransferase [Lysobacter caseinilyticus]BCT94433.1 SAM-dependent methyltransferase [Lysobacter helvus]
MNAAHASWWALFRQWLRNPLRTAAVVPSSRELAAAMVAELPPGTARVIELGGGTGALTRALLAHGVHGDALLVLELNEELHAHLHARFPAVRVELGDARDLPGIAERTGYLAAGPADAIISGLGLLTMPAELQRAIVAAAFQCLRPDGRFIQFTYGPQAPIGDAVAAELGLQVRRGTFILRNVPPATVYVYEQARRG